MTLLEAINSKNTVKTFQSRKVGDEIFQGILKFAEILQLPMASAAVDLEVAGSAGDARRQLGVKAPYFLFIYTENQEEGSLNAGYTAEQLSLYLWTKGLGSRILGFREDLSDSGRRRGRGGAVLAFGWPQNRGEAAPYGDRVLENGKESKSWTSAVLEQAGIHGEGRKLRHLRFDVSQQGIDCYRKKHFFQAKRKSLQDSFEAGRLLAHIFVAAEDLWLRLEVVSDMQKSMDRVKGEYLLTIQEKKPAAERTVDERFPRLRCQGIQESGVYGYPYGRVCPQRPILSVKGGEALTGPNTQMVHGAAAQRA